MNETHRKHYPAALPVSPAIDQQADWQTLLADSITSAGQLADRLPTDPKVVDRVIARYPMRINPYYLSLIYRHGAPLHRQAVPRADELLAGVGQCDPLREEKQSPAEGIVHRYPDRVIFLVSNRCAVYCRFCMRRRHVGRDSPVEMTSLKEGLAYIRSNSSIREVILSGGDPLLRTDGELEWLLTRLQAISHVEIIRIHSRISATLPQRITPELAATLQKFSPLYVITHFNHAAELTPQAETACRRLVAAGIPLFCQSVLLGGVNDSPAAMQDLMRRLVAVRIRPYYLHQMDPVAGTDHFRVPIRKGLAIMQALRGYLSGLCVPQYMIDLPGGGGKVPLLPEYIKSIGESDMTVENFQGERFRYPLD